MSNFGTPQEMYDDNEENNPVDLESKTYGCIFYVLFIVIVITVIKYL